MTRQKLLLYITPPHRFLHKIICAEKQQSLKSFSNVCFRKDGKRRDVNDPDVMLISELSQSGS